MKLSIIVAVSDNGVIGYQNDLPWRLSSDLKRFKSITMGHSILMGRKTFESLPKLLPGRKTVILTRQLNYKFEGATVVDSLEAAIDVCSDEPEAFVIGGAEIYHQALSLADRLYLTKVHAEIKGDTYFPPINWRQWKQLEVEQHETDERNQYPTTFSIYERIEAGGSR